MSNDPLPLLDKGLLDEFRQSIRPAQFAAIMAVFLEDAASRMERIRMLAGTGDLGALGGECHDAASTLGTFGAVGPMHLARRVMMAARDGDRATAMRLLPDLLARTAALGDELRHRLASGHWS